MKPYEYYNYPKRRNRMWWIPLAAVLLLTVGSSLLRSCRDSGAEADLPAATTGTEVLGVAEANTHTVLVDGQLYQVLDREYEGDFDLQTVCFLHGSRTDGVAGAVPVQVEAGVTVPEGFAREALLDRDAYEAFCGRWGLTPAFPAHAGLFAVVARAVPGAERAEIQLGDVLLRGGRVTVLLRDRLSGAGQDALGFVLTLPVPASVTELKTEALYSQAEIGK